jgi:hypothetical protein
MILRMRHVQALGYVCLVAQQQRHATNQPVLLARQTLIRRLRFHVLAAARVTDIDGVHRFVCCNPSLLCNKTVTFTALSESVHCCCCDISVWQQQYNSDFQLKQDVRRLIQYAHS